MTAGIFSVCYIVVEYGYRLMEVRNISEISQYGDVYVMETSRKEKNLLIKTLDLIALIVLILTVFAVGMRVISYFVNVQPDKNKNMPRDIAKHFICAAKAANYKKARQYFSEKALNSINNSIEYGYKFENYCDQFKEFTPFKYLRAGMGKSGYRWLTVSGYHKEKVEYYTFYLKCFKNEWLIESVYYTGQRGSPF